VAPFTKLNSKIGTKMNYKKIHDFIIARAQKEVRIYDSTIHHLHHIIPRHECSCSNETVILTHKEHYIIHFLRYKFIGSLGNLIAYYTLRKISIKENSNLCGFLASQGKIGGKITKENCLGIFSPNWDRSAHMKKLHSPGGVFYENKEYYRNLRKKTTAGIITKQNKKGIFDPLLQYKRTEWAKLGAKALCDSGNRSGIYSEKWRDENQEFVKKNASKAGRLGGKKVGKMKWWNNGKVNKRSNECPGPDFVRGQLLSKKKQESCLKNIKKANLHNCKMRQTNGK
jgi:hypothetical protein